MMLVRLRVLVASLVAQPLAASLQMRQSSLGDPQFTTGYSDGVGILAKIEDLVSEGMAVCLTMDSDLSVGGLLNTMGMVNAVMDFALQHKDLVEFVMPEMRPTDESEDFRFMFGEPALLDETRWPKMFIATCPFDVQLDSEDETFGQCSINETMVYGNTVFVQSRAGPECGAYMMVSSAIRESHDYSRTGPVLSELYWQRQAELGKPKPSWLQFPTSTAVQLFQGSSEKVHADVFHQVASALTSLIDPRCLKVALYSDMNESDAVLQSEKSYWKSNSVDEVQVFDISTKAIAVFDGLASASILIGGPGGFAQLAAVVGRSYANIFINGTDYTMNEASGGSLAFFSSSSTSLFESTSLTTVIEGCNAWLGK